MNLDEEKIYKATLQSNYDQKFTAFLGKLVEKLEGELGNGKVISGSIGPLFDMGVSVGYDMAIKRAKEIAKELGKELEK